MNFKLSTIEQKGVDIRYFLLLVAFGLFPFEFIKGQYQFDFNYLSADNGLSQNVVNTMLQDSRGFLWIGTGDGLSRYDGFETQVYQTNLIENNTLLSNSINALIEDRLGNIWIGYFNSGISVYNPTEHHFKQYEFAYAESDSLKFNIIHDFDRKGDVLVALSDIGVALYNELDDSMHLIKVDSVYENWRTIFIENDSTAILSTTDKKVLKLSINSGKLTDFKVKYSTPIATNLHSFVKTGEHEYALILENVVYQVSSIDGKAKLLQHFDSPLTALGYSNGVLWIGGYDMIIYKYRFDNQAKKAQRITDIFNDYTRLSTVRSLLISKEGIVWVGSNGLGVSKLYERNKQFGLLTYDPNIVEGVLNQSIRSLLPISRNEVLIGGYSGFELYNFKLEQSTILFDRLKKNEKIIPYSLLRDVRDTQIVWVGSEGYGLMKFDIRTKDQELFEIGIGYLANLIQSMQWISPEIIVLGTANGIFLFDTEKRQVLTKENEILLQNETIRFIYPHQNGIYFAGTQSGKIYRLKQNENALNVDALLYENPKVVPTMMMKDAIEELWLGTNAGLISMTENFEVKEVYTTSNGLPNNTIYSINQDVNNNLWMSTNFGISKFDQLNNQFTNYTINDGLQSNEFNYNAHANWNHEIIYLGGVNGVNFFEPDKISSDTVIHEVYISYIQTPTEKNIFKENSVYELNHDDKEIRIFYSTPIFTNQNATGTYYRIVNQDTTWTRNELVNRLVLSNLIEGEYEVQLIRSQANQFEKAPITSVSFIKKPVFYKTTEFLTMVILAMIGFVTYVVYTKTNKLKREIELSTLYSQQLMLFQEKERKRISEALHDSIGSKMMLIKMTFKQYRMQKTVEKQESSSKEINNLIGDTIEEIREISHNLHPHLLEKLGLSKTIESLLDSINSIAPLKISYTIESIDSYFSADESLYLYRFVQESITNVLRHSKAESCVFELKELKSDDQKGWYCSIKDDGIGIDEKRLDNMEESFGLHSLREISDYLEAKISIDSMKNRGTTIKLAKN